MLDLLTDGGADISPCGEYRYRLWRRWSDGPSCTFVMLNPSTADAWNDDPTIRRCIGFAKREGCGSLIVVNLFAYRATDPKSLFGARVSICGPENDGAIREAAGVSSLVIAAWGAHRSVVVREDEVIEIIASAGRQVQCLGVTMSGRPRHPLYVRGDATLVPFPHWGPGASG